MSRAKQIDFEKARQELYAKAEKKLMARLYKSILDNIKHLTEPGERPGSQGQGGT